MGRAMGRGQSERAPRQTLAEAEDIGVTPACSQAKSVPVRRSRQKFIGDQQHAMPSQALGDAAQGRRVMHFHAAGALTSVRPARRDLLIYCF